MNYEQIETFITTSGRLPNGLVNFISFSFVDLGLKIPIKFSPIKAKIVTSTFLCPYGTSFVSSFLRVRKGQLLSILDLRKVYGMRTLFHECYHWWDYLTDGWFSTVKSVLNPKYWSKETWHQQPFELDAIYFENKAHDYLTNKLDELRDAKWFHD